MAAICRLAFFTSTGEDEVLTCIKGCILIDVNVVKLKAACKRQPSGF
jgi:hypothetical protein